MGYDLWPKPFRLSTFARSTMRVSDDVRRTVGFIGHLSSDQAFSAIGTCFLFNYKRHSYLVTNSHIAYVLAEDPFAVRFSDLEGNSVTFMIDPISDKIEWLTPEDTSVDLAIIPFNVNFSKFECKPLSLTEDMILTEERITYNDIGAGDLCYAIGLFRLMAGKERNLPFVHTGNIGIMATDEKIPTKSWMQDGETTYVSGHLVQITNLQGLSGSPVFVRPVFAMRNPSVVPDTNMSTIIPRNHLFLLGVWQSSWDAPMSHAALVDRGTDKRVPVGVGVVVPSSKIIDVLESGVAINLREEFEKTLIFSNASEIDDASSS